MMRKTIWMQFVRQPLRRTFICRRLHHPKDKPEDISSELGNHPIQLVICDLYLQAEGALGGAESAYGTIGSILENLGLRPWSPYVMLLWSKDARDTNLVDGLRVYLEARISPQFLPCAIIPLDKIKYGITDKPTTEQTEALWKDLQVEVTKSRGVKLLMQWEAELHRAAGQVTRNLIAAIRKGEGAARKIDIDDEIDTLLSRVASAATSSDFAQEFPRTAAVEGLLPLVSDQYQHQQLSENERAIWNDGLQQAKTKAKQKPLSMPQAAALNSALHIARDDSVESPERGSVYECTMEELKVSFGLDHADKQKLNPAFGIKGKWPANVLFRLIQVEGACDAAQRKNGVVPLLLAIEVDATQELFEKGDGLKKRPMSVDETPIFLNSTGAELKKLVVNARYYFTLSREQLKTKKPIYRLRESLVASLAYAWVNHTIRPGIVSFAHGEAVVAPDGLTEMDEISQASDNHGWMEKIKSMFFGK
jgi:hypothetical protein